MGNVSLEPLTTQTSQSHKPKRLRSTGEIKHLRIVLQYMYSVTFHHCLLCTFHIRNFNLWHLTLHLVSANVFRSVVGTFLCGPAALATVLEKKCAKYSDVDPRKTKFYFNKENFWAKKKQQESSVLAFGGWKLVGISFTMNYFKNNEWGQSCQTTYDASWVCFDTL